MILLTLSSQSFTIRLTSSLRLSFENELLAEQLAIEVDRAERASLAKSEFLSRMSHELRTPMNAVMGFGQLLQLAVKEDDQKQYIKHMLAGADHLLDLINEVLDLARIESGKFELKMENHSLSTLLENCLTLLVPLNAEKNIQLIIKAADCNVLVDERYFRQVMLNILANAIVYSHTGSSIQVTAESLSVDMLRVSVIDYETGISVEDISMIFEPFNRGTSDKNEIPGTGIGLSIGKSLVELMGGKIGVSSEENKGSTFWIDIHLSEESMN